MVVSNEGREERGEKREERREKVGSEISKSGS